MAGTTPWKPPNAKPLSRDAMPSNSCFWAAFSKAVNRVRPLRKTQLAVRGMLCDLISLSGMKLHKWGWQGIDEWGREGAGTQEDRVYPSFTSESKYFCKLWNCHRDRLKYHLHTIKHKTSMSTAATHRKLTYTYEMQYAAWHYNKGDRLSGEGLPADKPPQAVCNWKRGHKDCLRYVMFPLHCKRLHWKLSSQSCNCEIASNTHSSWSLKDWLKENR